ncbi:hypothetical protein RF11_13378 [Thelohanellus kitauei]|uniref:Uncharacterized protein n=1 Tax=Thelohanellus kitauei TaxID=669202 RepID=A0A0C2MEP1_THEKT|nr:hypothetical protein RF11_13378 [Thelohanellus kitauei]
MNPASDYHCIDYFKSEHKISSNKIYLYSRSDELSIPDQIKEAIPDLSNIPIQKCKYENGNLFIFHIYDPSKFIKIVHLNGSELSTFINFSDGTKEYSITYGDDVTYLIFFKVSTIYPHVLCIIIFMITHLQTAVNLRTTKKTTTQ